MTDRRRAIAGWTRALLCAFLALVVCVLGASPAATHNLGDSYLYLQIYEDAVSGRFEIALSDLNSALGFSGTDREITLENLDERISFLEDYYLEHVTISDDRGPLAIELGAHGFLDARGGYVLLPFDLGGLDGVPATLTVDYSVLFDEEPGHRGFLLIEHNWATGTFANENRVSLVFSPSSRRQTLDVTSSGRLRGFLALARLGAEHMAEGLDHVLFLVALMLSVALRREDTGWEPTETLREAGTNWVRIVTAFLLAQSLALTTAALGLLHLPEAVIETAIALSTLLAAAHLLVPVLGIQRWWVLFALSFFHGLGFSGALTGLGVLDDSLAMSLVAFNLGVGASFVLIAAVLFPILLLARNATLYRRGVAQTAAVALIVISGVWATERSLGVDLPMRELLPSFLQKVIP